MNDIQTQTIDELPLGGDIRADIITALGEDGDRFKLNVPEGHVARLWDFSVYARVVASTRYGVNLYKGLLPRDGVRAWTNDSEVLRDGGVLAALSYVNITGGSGNFFPHSEHLWDLDYRLAIGPRVGGFMQTATVAGFRLRYRIIRASDREIAAILFWQNAGIKQE